jgi:hypothetical protein
MRVWLIGLMGFLVSSCASEVDQRGQALAEAAACVLGDPCWSASVDGWVGQTKGFQSATHCKRPQDFTLLEERYLDDGSAAVLVTCAPDGRNEFVFGVDIQPDDFGWGSNYAVAYAKCRLNKCDSVRPLVTVG